MNESQTTRVALIAAAQRLFAQDGYDGTSIKAITSLANANLGAVTYHFGTKEQLYHEVLRGVGEPFLERLTTAQGEPGPALDRIEALVRAFFTHLSENPEMPSLMMHELSLRRPVPTPLRKIMGQVFQTISALIREGQREGTIAAGDVKLLVVSVLALPAWVMWMRVPLGEVAGLDIHNSRVRQQLLDHLVISIRRSLKAQPVKPARANTAASRSKISVRRRK